MSRKAASVMLKLRSEKLLPPGRKLLSLKLKALLNKDVYHLGGTFWLVGDGTAGTASCCGSTMVATTVDVCAEFSDMCEMAGFSS